MNENRQPIRADLQATGRDKEITGHEFMALERFTEDTRHMIVFDVLTWECPVGNKGERVRIFLTDEGYTKALQSQERGEMQIVRHARVQKDELFYNAPDVIQEGAHKMVTESSVTDAIKREIDIVEYAKLCGLHPVPHGTKGKLKTTEHDSLIFTPAENKFSWNSRSTGGSVIDFAMVYHGLSIRGAISQLRLMLDGKYEHAKLKRTAPTAVKEPSPPREFKLPEKSTTGYSRVFGYLVKTRGIDKDIVQQAVAAKQILQDARGNVCFCGYDYDGQVQYASLRTTNTEAKFRGEAAGSRKEVGFSSNLVNCHAEKLFVTEAPIENLSIMTMLKMHGRAYDEYAYLSLGGTDSGALLYHLKHHPELQTVYLCHNNDDAGHKSRAACRAVLAQEGFRGEVVDKPPHQNDYNDDLKKLQEHPQKQQTLSPTIERGMQHEI